ncbi:HNH endonuclease family protein [Streptomyces rubiginosohelvolus]|uniref:HNH endonuclease family protein n=1 Tax=Streptomyces rubiginosohelvolus TaxID=67362 RepID=UPI00369630C0
MIKNLMRCGLPALAFAALPLLVATAPAVAGTQPTRELAHTPFGAAEAPISARGRLAPLSLVDAVVRVPVASEQREGNKRELYKHWTKGLDARDGCDTRREVIISEAIEAPVVAAACKLTGGSWLSPYDGVTVTDAAGLDVDHMVPLAEVHDSGGHAWDAERREAYANDQGSPATLIAVTARSNRSKSDKDPAQWLPPAADYRCAYAAEWTGTKLRWGLAADGAERQALLALAGECPTTTVVYETAP